MVAAQRLPLQGPYAVFEPQPFKCPQKQSGAIAWLWEGCEGGPTVNAEVRLRRVSGRWCTAQCRAGERLKRRGQHRHAIKPLCSRKNAQMRTGARRGVILQRVPDWKGAASDRQANGATAPGVLRPETLTEGTVEDRVLRSTAVEDVEPELVLRCEVYLHLGNVVVV